MKQRGNVMVMVKSAAGRGVTSEVIDLSHTMQAVHLGFVVNLIQLGAIATPHKRTAACGMQRARDAVANIRHTAQALVACSAQRTRGMVPDKRDAAQATPDVFLKQLRDEGALAVKQVARARASPSALKQ